MSQSPSPEGRDWSAIFPRYWVKHLTQAQIRFRATTAQGRWPSIASGECGAEDCTQPFACSAWERVDKPGSPEWQGVWLCSEHGEEWAAEHGAQSLPADPRYSVWVVGPEDRDSLDVCQVRGCGVPATHVSYTQDASRIRPMESEFFRCTRHAEEYARRHHVEIRPLIERGPR